MYIRFLFLLLKLDYTTNTNLLSIEDIVLVYIGCHMMNKAAPLHCKEEAGFGVICGVLPKLGLASWDLAGHSAIKTTNSLIAQSLCGSLNCAW